MSGEELPHGNQSPLQYNRIIRPERILPEPEEGKYQCITLEDAFRATTENGKTIIVALGDPLRGLGTERAGVFAYPLNLSSARMTSAGAFVVETLLEKNCPAYQELANQINSRPQGDEATLQFGAVYTTDTDNAKAKTGVRRTQLMHVLYSQLKVPTVDAFVDVTLNAASAQGLTSIDLWPFETEAHTNAFDPYGAVESAALSTHEAAEKYMKTHLSTSIENVRIVMPSVPTEENVERVRRILDGEPQRWQMLNEQDGQVERNEPIRNKALRKQIVAERIGEILNRISNWGNSNGSS